MHLSSPICLHTPHLLLHLLCTLPRLVGGKLLVQALLLPRQPRLLLGLLRFAPGRRAGDRGKQGTGSNTGEGLAGGWLSCSCARSSDHAPGEHWTPARHPTRPHLCCSSARSRAFSSTCCRSASCSGVEWEKDATVSVGQPWFNRDCPCRVHQLHHAVWRVSAHPGMVRPAGDCGMHATHRSAPAAHLELSLLPLAPLRLAGRLEGAVGAQPQRGLLRARRHDTGSHTKRSVLMPSKHGGAAVSGSCWGCARLLASERVRGQSLPGALH